jgi:hypothetical protein
MKYTNTSLKNLIKHLREAEEKAKEGGEEANPFAASEEGGEDKGGEESGGESKDKEDKGGEEGGDSKGSKQPAEIPLKFNLSKVKQYNPQSKFLSDTGTVKSIDKRGIVVTTQPDGVDVLVNFSDIEDMSESVKKFFKNKK